MSFNDLESRCLVIAEAGVNHDGQIDKAFALVDAAVEAGADIVKFQIFSPKDLCADDAEKAPYQQEAVTNTESQQEMLSKLVLSQDEFSKIKNYTEERGVVFAATPFDHGSLAFLDGVMQPKFIKIGSGDLTNAPLLWNAAATQRPMIVSTGMASREEIASALDVIAHGYLSIDEPKKRNDFEAMHLQPNGMKVLSEKLCLLHCVSAYPTPMEEANIQGMVTLRNWFRMSVGYSDHTTRLDSGLVAVASGAKVIEKHLTLDRFAAGPDHAASLDPQGLKDYIKAIRDGERLLGSGEKSPNKVELANRTAARRGLKIKRALSRDHRLRPEDLSVKRPETGLSPFDYWDVIGKEIQSDVGQDTPINNELFERNDG